MNVVMLIVIVLIVIMLSIIMLSVFMLNVILLNVVVPFKITELDLLVLFVEIFSLNISQWPIAVSYFIYFIFSLVPSLLNYDFNELIFRPGQDQKN
jgi:hypothetical protein